MSCENKNVALSRHLCLLELFLLTNFFKHRNCRSNLSNIIDEIFYLIRKDRKQNGFLTGDTERVCVRKRFTSTSGPAFVHPAQIFILC